MKRSADVLIVGGGIIGCSIAYFLRKQGVEVLMLEKGDIGAQASSAAAGLLAPIRLLSQRDPFKALQLAGLTRFSSLVPELEAVSGINVDYEQTGTLRLLPAEKLVPVYTWAEAWRRSGYHIEVLTPEETYKREPLLYPELHGAQLLVAEGLVEEFTPIGGGILINALPGVCIECDIREGKRGALLTECDGERIVCVLEMHFRHWFLPFSL